VRSKAGGKWSWKWSTFSHTIGFAWPTS